MYRHFLIQVTLICSALVISGGGLTRSQSTLSSSINDLLPRSIVETNNYNLIKNIRLGMNYDEMIPILSTIPSFHMPKETLVIPSLVQHDLGSENLFTKMDFYIDKNNNLWKIAFYRTSQDFVDPELERIYIITLIREIIELHDVPIEHVYQTITPKNHPDLKSQYVVFRWGMNSSTEILLQFTPVESLNKLRNKFQIKIIVHSVDHKISNRFTDTVEIKNTELRNTEWMSYLRESIETMK